MKRRSDAEIAAALECCAARCVFLKAIGAEPRSAQVLVALALYDALKWFQGEEDTAFGRLLVRLQNTQGAGDSGPAQQSKVKPKERKES